MAKVMKFRARKQNRPKSQPRISGVSRSSMPSGLLPEVEHGIRSISRKENRSVSWVIAEIVCAFFGLDSASGKVISAEEKKMRMRK